MSPKLTKLELQIMEVLWAHGPLPVRDVQARLPKQPAYTTVQTMMYRLESKKALRRTSKVGNAHLFEASIARGSAHKRLIDEFLSIFGGSAQLVMAHLVDAGKLSLDDVLRAEARLRELQKAKGRK
jgi:BlaI family penicillinase repressor